MSETSQNEARRPVGFGLVATPLPPSLSLPLRAGENTAAHPPVLPNVAKCGSFFERHPDAVPRRAPTRSKADLFATSRLHPMDTAPSSPPPRRGRDRAGGNPHGTEPATTPTHDHEIAAARIPPAGAARA